ncbi:MAG TPA: hypothetical protein VLB84_02505 [Bacteroidia bacterium]|jgi:hypothetical protein|nr:hypothetical protein [Bacteroidia bacterium]
MEKFAETFKQNANNFSKLFQESTKTLIETQAKQMAFITGLYNTGTFQKNVEALSDFSKDTTKKFFDYFKTYTSMPLELMDTAFDMFSKQAENMNKLNQRCLDEIAKHSNHTKSFVDSSTIDKFKKDMETNMKLFKETTSKMTDNYKKMLSPTLESNKKFLNDMNDQMEASLNSSRALWSNLLDMYNIPEYEAKNKTGTSDKNSRNNGHTKKTASTLYNPQKN